MKAVYVYIHIHTCTAAAELTPLVRTSRDWELESDVLVLPQALALGKLV